MSAKTYQDIARARLAAGRCASCGRMKDAPRRTFWRCSLCVEKYRHPKARHRGPHNRQPIEPTSRAGTIPCLKCGLPLASPDPKLIRLHDHCRHRNTWIQDSLASEEAIYA